MAINTYMIPFTYRYEDSYGRPVYYPVHFDAECWIVPKNKLIFDGFKKRPHEILLYWTRETNEFILCDAKTRKIISDYTLTNWKILRNEQLAESASVEFSHDLT